MKWICDGERRRDGQSQSEGRGVCADEQTVGSIGVN